MNPGNACHSLLLLVEHFNFNQLANWCEVKCRFSYFELIGSYQGLIGVLNNPKESANISNNQHNKLELTETKFQSICKFVWKILSYSKT